MNAKGICLKIVSVILSAVMLFPYCTVEAGNSMKAGQDCIELIKKCEGFSNINTGITASGLSAMEREWERTNIRTE